MTSNRLQMWRTACGYANKEQAIVLLKSLNENKKAEKAVTTTAFNVDDGLEKLLEKLESTFEMQKMQESYSV